MKVTKAWHLGDVGLSIISIKEKNSILNWIRLGYAVVGLVGNVVIAQQEAKYKR